MSLKTVFIGSINVGKTSIVHRLIWDRFDQERQSTIGAAFSKVQNLDIWDTAGQERFKSIVPMYMRNAVNAVIVYDATTKDSYIDATEYWYQMVLADGEITTRVFLVRNKSDCILAPAPWDEGEAWAYDHTGVSFVETSAKEGTGIEELFDLLCDHVAEPMPSFTNTTTILADGVDESSFCKC
jgi:small GTP-binding protein